MMKKFFFLPLLIICFNININAQVKRALLIGIDIYQPVNVEEIQKTRGGWTNLDGCVNDAISIGEIIRSRFGFMENNITTLYNQEANRESIIRELEKLIETSQQGDVVFIYYAGHGSQVNNSLSTEVSGDKKDESIVPADMIDIRDKELAFLFNKLLDKGVTLTLIFDSCHSGSIARGNNVPDVAKTRHLNGSAADALDPSNPPLPEDRGALIFSAAQPEQLAKEAIDDQGNPHGAFTVALIKALNSSPVNESAEVLFLRIKAIMQANGNTQEPVLGGNDVRRKQGLFGENLDEISGKTVVAVLKNTNADNIELQGGWAIGLNENCELKKIGSDVVITITDVKGLAKSQAKLKSGDFGEVKPGDLFEIISYSSAGNPNLRVWFPTNKLSNDDVLKVAENISGLKTDKNYIWIDDPSAEEPQYVIQYYNESWKIYGPQGKTYDVGKNPTAESVAKKINKGSSIFLQLPPSLELVSKLNLGTGTENGAIEITSNPLNADYILMGAFRNENLQYAWVKPNITVNDTSFLSTLPVRTDWFSVRNETEAVMTGEKLTEYALRLGKVNAWLNLSSPPDDGSFPFTLALKNMSVNEYVTSGSVYGGEQYSLVMLTTKEKLKKWTGKSRYVYVFTIDVSGHTQQIFPFQNTGNEGNKLPNKAYEFEEEISLGQVSFTISEPYGVDSYFMITSDEAINNFQAFNSDGVITRSGGSGSALENLIGNVGANTRGISNNTPVNWSFQRIAVTSKAK